MNLPKSTKSQVKTHNKFLRRALITTPSNLKRQPKINGITKKAYFPVNGNSFSVLDEEEYNPKLFDTIIPHSVSGFLLASLPIIIPIAAFDTFEYTSNAFQQLLTILSDGSEGITCNVEEVSIVANGIVVTSIALLFATMASVTVSSLRERLRELRIHLNNEASILQELVYFIDSMSIPSSTRKTCMNYVETYTDRLISESQSRVDYNIPLLNSELNLIRQVICLPKDGDANDKNNFVIPYVNTAICELKEYRSNRIALLQSNFPLAHYITLATLAFSICIIFLIDAGCKVLATDVLILKIFWAMTLGTFTILSTTCYDLRDPFQGSYAVCTRSFYFLKDNLHAKSMEMKGSGDSMDGSML